MSDKLKQEAFQKLDERIKNRCENFEMTRKIFTENVTKTLKFGKNRKKRKNQAKRE